jgi:hypothetical protein
MESGPFGPLFFFDDCLGKSAECLGFPLRTGVRLF